MTWALDGGLRQIVVLQWALGLLLVVSATAKMRNVSAVARMVRSMKLGFYLDPYWIAFSVIALELVLGVALVVGERASLVAGSTSVFLACTGVAIARTVVGGKPIPCACFGDVTNHPISWGVLARVVSLLAVAFSLWIDGTLFPITSLRQVDAFEVVVSATGAVALTLSFYLLSQLEQIALEPRGAGGIRGAIRAGVDPSDVVKER